MGQASRRRTRYAFPAIWPKSSNLSVCGDRPVSIAKKIFLLVSIYIWFDEHGVPPLEFSQDVWPKVFKVSVAGTGLCPPPRTSPCFLGPEFARRTWYASQEIRPKIMSQRYAGTDLCPSPSPSPCFFCYASALERRRGRVVREALLWCRKSPYRVSSRLGCAKR